jgi:putative addiction module component (TIGR02574 family)
MYSRWRNGMKAKSKDLLKEALDLPAVERARLVDQLLSSLDNPDKSIDDVWRGEIAARLQAYRTGKTPTVSAEDVLSEYRRK